MQKGPTPDAGASQPGGNLADGYAKGHPNRPAQPGKESTTPKFISSDIFREMERIRKHLPKGKTITRVELDNLVFSVEILAVVCSSTWMRSQALWRST